MAIVALTAMAAVPRVFAASPGIFGDELYTFAIAQEGTLRDVLAGVRDTENTPPLYYVLAWLAAKLGDDPQLIRLPAILCGVATVPVVALLARRVYGDRAGLLAAALVAASPFAVYYSSEARAYGPVMLAVAVATLALFRALDTDKRGWWATLTLSVAAALWLHYIAIFPLAVQIVWAVVVRPERRRRVLLAHAAGAALYLPWLPFAGQYAPLLSDFKLSQLVDFPLRLLVGWPYRDAAEVPGVLTLVGFVLVLVVVGAAARRSRRSPRLSDPGAMLLAAALAAPVGLLAYTAVADGIFHARNMIVSLPAALTLLAGLIARRQPALAVAVGLAAVALLIPTTIGVAFGDLRRPAYDEVAALLDREAGPGDAIVEEPGGRPAGPARHALSAFLQKPQVLLSGPRAVEAGWRAGLRGSRVFWVYSEHSVPRRVRIDPRFAPVAHHTWSRRNFTLLLTEFAPVRRE